ncbi:DUF998 domain-containing protein [Actinokineospora globicatena]|uniref:DUF998 domain-containing protein n=1 Tax=Actinokineospora globicatena TaxID=103729 RepID=UPI0020A3DA89|nr:DUF998 domain-containing protein [Actinokineospora globicatena]MCP2306851.1 Protein of unknown function (DUF998) [Actinokineospora globicatena]GLW82292.1 hypothetical protein Aglo01_67730 [Actinokineospora globicatena]GLW89115.1 hypothetical protein Aglo02_67540 [Actinokineospora globicatena]
MAVVTRTGRTGLLWALGGLLGGVAALLALHVLPPTNEISPVRRTISEYALSDNKWLFDAAIVLIAASSAVGFVELWRRRAHVPTAVLGAIWTLSLLTVVLFTKNDWSVGPSTGGMIHRYASVAAFLSLPSAVLLAAGRAFPAHPAWRWATRTCGALSLLWFSTIVIGALNMLTGGQPWWRFVPLGLVERLIAGSAVAGLALLILGLLHLDRRPLPTSP